MNRFKKILVSFVKNLIKDEEAPQEEKEIIIQEVVEAPDPEGLPKNKERLAVSDKEDEKDIERLEKLLKDVLFSDKPGKPKAPLSYFLNSGEDQWFYAPNSRSMIRVPGGIQLIVQDPTPDDDGRILCYCDFGFILIPSEEISPLGAN